MKVEESFAISIPADEDGQVLLKCPVCGEMFKVSAAVFGDDTVFAIHCPKCGMISDNYVTEDVIILAQNMMGNYVNDLLTKELKKLEKATKKNGLISFKIKSTFKRHSEQPIMLTVENMTRVEYPCCQIVAKIRPILRMCGGYCPYCGEKYYGIE